MRPESAMAGRRLTSIDAYRGIVMFLMLAEVLRFAAVSAARPESAFWRFVAGLQTHAAWTGCSLHDLIQPGFTSWSAWRCHSPSPPAGRRGRSSPICCAMHWFGPSY